MIWSVKSYNVHPKKKKKKIQILRGRIKQIFKDKQRRKNILCDQSKPKEKWVPTASNAGQSSLDTHMPTFHEGHTARAVFISGLAFGFSAFFKKLGFSMSGLCRLFACFVLFVCFVSVVKLDCFDVLCWRAYLTYSADFQKCPGWERRRFRLGNFSSKSTSLEKLGRSSGLYAQHRSRISWKTREQMSQTYFRNSK